MKLPIILNPSRESLVSQTKYLSNANIYVKGSLGLEVLKKDSEIIISSTEVIRNIYRANTIKREVYDFLFLWNPNDMQAMNHPPTQILTVLGF